MAVDVERKLQDHPLFRMLGTGLISGIVSIIVAAIIVAYTTGKIEATTTVRINVLETAQKKQEREQEQQKKHQAHIREKLNNVDSDVKVLNQRFIDKDERDKKFQGRTEIILDRIDRKLNSGNR